MATHREEGPSPRTRGNRPCAGLGQSDDGTIPADAGEPHDIARDLTFVWDHPRGRGGTSLAARMRAAWGGPSPRTRGNLRCSIFGSATMGTIPADAGEPSCAPGATCNWGDHPRGRGGTATIARPPTRGKGPSPRTRGNPLRCAARILVNRTIPADAGEPWQRGKKPRRCRDHPRGRGGTLAKTSLLNHLQGPSPRTRGNRQQDEQGAVRRGTIPADAGEPGRPARADLARWDHPRGRGGTGGIALWQASLKGPSPRTRGNLDRNRGRQRWIGTIPADAGEPRAASRRRAAWLDHPRGRGGTDAQCACPGPAKGPSPRTRGNQSPATSLLALHGTIPADAGEPRPSSNASGVYRDHPRGRGGTERTRTVTPRKMGPSPRTRGNLTVIKQSNPPRGTIPADAGEPSRRRFTIARLRDHPRGRGGTCKSVQDSPV